MSFGGARARGVPFGVLKDPFLRLNKLLSRGTRDVTRGQRTPPALFIFDESESPPPAAAPAEANAGANAGGRADNDEGKKRARDGRRERSTKASVVSDSSRFCRGFDVYFARTFLAHTHTHTVSDQAPPELALFRYP